MIEKYNGGFVPELTEEGKAKAGEAEEDFVDYDAQLREIALGAAPKVEAQMDEFKFNMALEEIWIVVRRANKYIDETMPWALAKDPEKKGRLGTVLYNLLEAIRWGASLLAPFLPDAAEEIRRMIGTDVLGYDTIGTEAQFCGTKAGNCVGESKVLFARVDEAKKLAEFEAARQAQIAAAKAAEEKDAPVEKPEGCALIGIEDFGAVELRTAKVIACERVPKAKKLLKLQIDLGYEQRQVVSGIAKFYAPEDLIGRKVIVVANLKPAVLCGIESNGMILASGEETVRVVFLAEDTPLGERVR
jgi:methionyl-tRNA synthetase